MKNTQLISFILEIQKNHNGTKRLKQQDGKKKKMCHANTSREVGATLIAGMAVF